MHRGINYPVICLVCNKSFLVEKYRISKVKFCSMACYGNSKKGLPNVNKGIARIDLRGQLHWNWKGGGRRTERKEQMAKVEYKNWRRSVFERDNYVCQFCGIKGGKLNAHHIRPFAIFPKLRYEISNGITLCEDCHSETPKFGGRPLKKQLVSRETKV